MKRKTTTQPDSSPAPSGVHLWLVLWKAARSVEAVAQRNIEASGMCRSDFGVLEALLHKGPLTVNALGAKVLLTSGSMTAAVDRLELRGLVRRRSDPTDRRVRVVHLTTRGRGTIGKLFSEHERVMEQTVSVLSANERARLVVLLRRLGRGAEALSRGLRDERAAATAREDEHKSRKRDRKQK